MTALIEARQLRDLIRRANGSSAIATAWLSELETIAARLEQGQSKYEQSVRFALSALLQSARRGDSNNWYVVDSELFVWAMDELDRLTR